LRLFTAFLFYSRFFGHKIHASPIPQFISSNPQLFNNFFEMASKKMLKISVRYNLLFLL